MKKFSIILIIRKPISIISDGLFGKQHTLTHRIIVGVIMMGVGVNIASLTAMVHIEVIKLGLDGIGYLIHGIGAVPFVDLLQKIAGNDED